MRLATVLTPITDQYLHWAAQCGVTDIVHRYHGTEFGTLVAAQRRIESFGMRLSVIEGYLPIEAIKLGQDDGTEREKMRLLVRQMGDLGVPLLCYNFMSGTDWVRTQLDAPERGGARVTRFSLRDAEQAVSLSHRVDGMPDAVADHGSVASCRMTQAQLWEHLERFLNDMIPVCESCGVNLAMHPDDPPLPWMLGKPRIMDRVEHFERLVTLLPSVHNGICFCQGTFAAMGVDIPSTIRRLGAHIRYVHFRDVRGTAGDFTETFHDNGPADMAAAMRAYRDVGFQGPIRPDHVPQLTGEEDGEPGYTMLGRLFAFGYIRGLMQGTACSTPAQA